MLKPVAAVGGALALAGAGAIGAVSLMENFVEAGIKGVEACDENPVGQVGPFKSTLSFDCTEGSTVITAAGLTADAQYASFRAPADLESVETGLFWPLFPNRNVYGQAEAFEAFPAGSPQIAEFESCENSWDGATSAGVSTFNTLLAGVVAGETANAQQGIADGNGLLKGGLLTNYFQNTSAGIVQFCQGVATGINDAVGAAVIDLADCNNVVDYAAIPTTDLTGQLRVGILAQISDATSLVEQIAVWNTSLTGAITDANIVSLVSTDTVGLAVTCQKAAIGGLTAAAGTTDPAILATLYPTVNFSPDACTAAYGPGGAAEAGLIAQVELGVAAQGVLTALVSGITGVGEITDLSNATQLEQLVEKCNDQEEDLSAIETAQILLPAGAAAAGVAAILLFVAVATAKAPLVLAGGVLGLVGGVLTMVALLGVRNAPVYANVGSEVVDGDVEYKSGFGATLGLAGIGAPVVGGLLGIGSFFCGTGEEGGALSSKVDNTY